MSENSGRRWLRRVIDAARAWKLDGPSPGAKHANGRLLQVRREGKPVFRLDIAPVEGGRSQRSVLHFHVGRDMRKHYIVDPRYLLWRITGRDRV